MQSDFATSKELTCQE